MTKTNSEKREMSEIVWVVTTCLIQSKDTAPSPEAFTSFNERKQDYMLGIPSVLRYAQDTEKVFLTENTGRTESFLDTFGVPVHYTNSQQQMFHENRGKKEIVDIVSCLDTHKIPDDAMVIKVTGRYIIESDTFPTLVRNHRDKEAVFSPTNMFKHIPPHPFPDCILGMIALKAKHWRAIPIHEIRPRIPTEWTVARYIANTIPKENRVEIETIDLSIKDDRTKTYWRV